MLLILLAVISLILSAIFCWLGSPIYLFPVFFIGCYLALFLAALLFLLIACALVNKEKPQEKDSRLFRWIARYYLQAAFPLAGVRFHTQGLEKLPKDGRYLLVCNHIHDLDPAILLHIFHKSRLAFIGKREVKDMFLIGSLMHKLQCQLINRENDREALKTILTCIDILKADKASIGVFPEGYVSLSGKLFHFRSGVFKIAQKANVPVVVCTINGSKEVLPALKKLKPSHVHVHLVDVIPADTVKQTNTVELAEQVYEMMVADLGEAYRTDEKAMHPDLQREKFGR